MLVDSHCHLDFVEFAADRGEVLARAEAAGVGAILTVSTKLSEFARVRAVAQAHSHVFCTVGVHPHDADREAGAADSRRIAALCDDPKVVGIGETGLDYYYAHSSHEGQQAAFRAHCAAARETGLPLVVHSRDAEADTLAILREEGAGEALSGVIHCFTGTPAMARAAIELGFYISFSGIVTFKNAEELRALAGDVPLDRLLVETDAPYLAPVPHRGKRNEPAFVADTAACLARLRGIAPEALAEATTANFFRLFAKAGLAAAP